MALTVSSLITAAKRTAFGKSGAQKISNARLLEELNYQDSIIVQMFAQNAPDLLATVTGSATVTLAKNLSGYTLEDGIAYRDFTHIDATDGEYTPITIVQRQHRHSQVTQPAAMISTGASAGILYPIDPQGDRWAGGGSRSWFDEGSGHTISYSYIPQPGGLTSMSDTLASPDMARATLVAALELAIILDNPSVQEAAVQKAMVKYDIAKASLLWQAYKFVAPQGSRGASGFGETDSEWVSNQVGG